MRSLTQLLLSAAVGMSAFAAAANAAELRQIGTISIPGEPLNSFDISWIDQASGLYFLADRSNKGIDIVDTKKSAWIGRVAGMVGPVMKKDGTCCNNDASGPNGVVTVGKEAWVGDGDSTVKVIDLKSMKIVDTIKTGGKARADELGYDPKDQVIAIANNADEPPFLTFISTKPGHKILGKLVMEHFSDGMEQTAYNPGDGLFYTDVPELDKDKTKGGLMVTDPKTAKVVKMISVDSCIPMGSHSERAAWSSSAAMPALRAWVCRPSRWSSIPSPARPWRRLPASADRTNRPSTTSSGNTTGPSTAIPTVPSWR